MKKLFLFSLIFAPVFSMAAIHTETVNYKHGGASLVGFLAYDDATTDRRPGVLVVHDWNGITDTTRNQVKRLAELGYVALAADIYGNGKVAADVDEAKKLSSFFKGDRNLMRGRVDAGVRALRKQERVDDRNIAAIGYCFGGTCVLELARAGANVNGVVSFHGDLATPEPAGAKDIRTKVLVLHGADDPYVPTEQVVAFEEEMRRAKADWQLVSYGNAVHGFTHAQAGTDNSKGYAYNETADRRSWSAMRAFFEEIFKK